MLNWTDAAPSKNRHYVTAPLLLTQASSCVESRHDGTNLRCNFDDAAGADPSPAAGCLGELVELYAPLVNHWCRRSDLPPEDAADVFQEVFGSVAASIFSFQRDRPGDTFRGWLRTVTTNKIRDHFRRQQDKKEAEGGTGAQMCLAEIPDPCLEEDEPSEFKTTPMRVARSLRRIFLSERLCLLLSYSRDLVRRFFKMPTGGPIRTQIYRTRESQTPTGN